MVTKKIQDFLKGMVCALVKVGSQGEKKKKNCAHLEIPLARRQYYLPSPVTRREGPPVSILSINIEFLMEGSLQRRLQLIARHLVSPETISPDLNPVSFSLFMELFLKQKSSFLRFGFQLVVFIPESFEC